MAGSHSRRMQPEVSKLNKSPGRQMSTDRSRRWVWGKISGHRGHFWVIKINYIMNDTGEGGRWNDGHKAAKWLSRFWPIRIWPTKEQQPSFDFCAVGEIKTNNVACVCILLPKKKKKCRQRCRARTGCAAGRVFVVLLVLSWPRQIPLSKTVR